MELVNPESHSVYRVEVSKTVGTYLLKVSVNSLGKLRHNRDISLPWSSVVQDNCEGIHAISRLVCEIWQKMSGNFLNLCLAQV